MNIANLAGQVSGHLTVGLIASTMGVAPIDIEISVYGYTARSSLQWSRQAVVALADLRDTDWHDGVEP